MSKSPSLKWLIETLNHSFECEWCEHHSAEEYERDFDWQVGETEYYTVHSCALSVFESIEEHLWVPNHKYPCKHFEHRYYGVEMCPKCKGENFSATESRPYHLDLYCHECKHQWKGP